MDGDLAAIVCTGMFQRFHHTQIAIAHLIVFADERDRHFFLGMNNIFHSFLPITEIKRVYIQS